MIKNKNFGPWSANGWPFITRSAPIPLPILKKTLTTEYTEDTPAFVLFFSVCSVYPFRARRLLSNTTSSVVEKSFEVFFVDDNKVKGEEFICVYL